MAIDADYTFELISIMTSAPQSKWHNKSFLGSVKHPTQNTQHALQTTLKLEPF